MRALAVLLLFIAPAAWACPGAEPIATTIPLVQGNGFRSPCEKQVVTVTGVVIGAFPALSGFFLQDPAGDGDAATSDGIFVFTGAAKGLPDRGSILRVTGKVAEFSRSGQPGSGTEIDVRASATSMAKTELLGAADPPAPLPLDPPGGADSAAYLEARTGMLVVYPLSYVMSPTNDFGEFYAIRFDRAPVAPRITRDDNATPLLIDQGLFRKEVKVFDIIPEQIGVLHFDFGVYRLEPIFDYQPGDAGWVPVPARASGTAFVSIATMNVQRLLTATLKPEQLETKLTKLALAIQKELRSPDILAIEEAGDLETLQNLGSRAGNYKAVLLQGCDFSGINSGLLFNPSRVQVLATSQFQAEAPQFNKASCTLPDGRSFTNILFDRPPLRVDLTVDSVPFTVIVNHWRSQIGGKDEQRQASAEFLAQQLTSLGLPNVIALGDFNDVETADSIRTFTERAGLTDTTLLAPIENRYSYSFEGRAEALDHILVSNSLAGRIQAAGYAHYNADFPIAPYAADAASPIRASDHDNAWVYLRKPAAP